MISPEKLLEKSDKTAGLLVHARILMRLGKCFSQFAPRFVPVGLSEQCVIANFRDGAVIIHTANNAIAAKIRQLAPRLCASFQENGFECTHIIIKIQPQKVKESNTCIPKPITYKSALILSDFAATMPPLSPLARAVRNLLEHALIEPQ